MLSDYVPYKVGDNVLVVKKRLFGFLGKNTEGALGKVMNARTFDDEDTSSIPFITQKLIVQLDSGKEIEVWCGEDIYLQKYQISKIS